MRWVLFLCGSVVLGQPVPEARRAEAYAVYSAVLNRPQVSHGGTNAKLLILETTGYAMQEEREDPRRCVEAPEAYRSAFSEALSDRDATRTERYRLAREFQLDKPYELLNEAQAAEFRRRRTDPAMGGSEVPELFRGATDYFTLGNVYFDRNRTVALVYSWAWCGSLCGTGSWRVFVKQGAEWAEQRWSRCMTVAEAPRGLKAAVPILLGWAGSPGESGRATSFRGR